LISSATYGWISLALTVIIYIPYVTLIVRRQTKPHAFTWCIWMLTISIVYFGQHATGAGPGAWASGLAAFLNGVIFLLALVVGERNITHFDWICFVLALSAIPLWVLAEHPLYSVLLSTAIDLAGYGPTFRKSYGKPHEENVSFFVIDVPACVFSILAIEHYNLTTLCSPVAIMVANIALIGMILPQCKTIHRRSGFDVPPA